MSESVGYLTTHVLDTAKGCPGSGIPVSLYKVEDSNKRLLASAITNSDGRCDAPIIKGEAFEEGVYELVFTVADYFSAGQATDTVPFLDEITLRFGVADRQKHYHIPLLVSEYSYSTYRGS